LPEHERGAIERAVKMSMEDRGVDGVAHAEIIGDEKNPSHRSPRLVCADYSGAVGERIGGAPPMMLDVSSRGRTISADPMTRLRSAGAR
jgi:hypothetical protein